MVIAAVSIVTAVRQYVRALFAPSSSCCYRLTILLKIIVTQTLVREAMGNVTRYIRAFLPQEPHLQHCRVLRNQAPLTLQSLLHTYHRP